MLRPFVTVRLQVCLFTGKSFCCSRKPCDCLMLLPHLRSSRLVVVGEATVWAYINLFIYSFLIWAGRSFCCCCCWLVDADVEAPHDEIEWLWIFQLADDSDVSCNILVLLVPTMESSNFHFNFNFRNVRFPFHWEQQPVLGVSFVKGAWEVIVKCCWYR